MNKLSSKVPTWFWIVAVIMLIWNLMGVLAFLQQQMMSPEILAEMPLEEQNLYKNMPMWVTVSFGLAVFGGFLGSLGLVLKKKWARPLFVISLLGIIGQMTYMFFMSNTFDVLPAGAMIMPINIIVFGLFLVWFAGHGIKKKWLT